MRRLLVGLAIARFVLGIVALPLAPFLYREHFAVLVLMRPTKEVLLAGGFLARRGDVSLTVIALAALPLLVGGVWLFFGLGRAYAKEIARCDLPGLAGKMLPPDRITTLRTVLKKKGTKVVLVGRIAAFPSALIAAAAGSAKLDHRGFAVADGVGAVLSLVIVTGAGFLLGDAYERAGPWLSVVGFLVLVAWAILLGRWLKKDSKA